MKKNEVKKLILIAKKRMSRSKDPIHDLAHVKRVVKYAKKFSKNAKLSEDEAMALELACFWHDVGRTVIKRPSIVIMSFIDDTISACMLLKEAILTRSWSASVRKAILLVLCNNAGFGPLFTKLLLSKQDRHLLNLLNDADNFDLFNYHRMNRIVKLADKSFIFHYGYKLTAWWFFKLEKIRFKTQEAKKYFREVLKQLSQWMMQDHIKKWHIETFGWDWCEKTLLRIHSLSCKYNY
ncbi:HD domain-containing protein [Candidatus Nomurabacteria bacterium]|nr:HD domain-containing protein [Candidatus Nomurabacteria bacterium]